MKKWLVVFLLALGTVTFGQVIEKNLVYPDSSVNYTDSVHIPGDYLPIYLKTGKLNQIDTLYTGFKFRHDTIWYKDSNPIVMGDSASFCFIPTLVQSIVGKAGADSLWIKFFGVADTTTDSVARTFILGLKEKSK